MGRRSCPAGNATRASRAGQVALCRLLAFVLLFSATCTLPAAAQTLTDKLSARAKPAVAAAAHARLDHADLTALLYAQGYRRSDFVA